jgi:hypothetical protein
VSLRDDARQQQKEQLRANGKVVEGEELCQDTDGDKSLLTILSPTVHTLEQLLERAQTDQTIWEVKRHILNQWQMGAKLPDGRIALTPLFQVKAWLERRQPIEVGLRAALQDLATHKHEMPKINYKASTSPYLLEVSIPDIHLGKLAWAPETGQNYDIDIAKACAMRAAENIIIRAQHFSPSRIVYVAGNDFYNTDNGRQTTGGTDQDEDGRWQKTFREGWKLQTWIINALRQLAPVDVIMVGGNHDWQRTFSLGEVLSAVFEGTDGVTIDNEPLPHKYYQWGKILFGYAHGHMIKRNQLADLMANEVPELYANSAWRAWRLGHLHHEIKELFVSKVGVRRTIVDTLPSLAGLDAYHKGHGYIGFRGAKAFLWNADCRSMTEFLYSEQDMLDSSVKASKHAKVFKMVPQKSKRKTK